MPHNQFTKPQVFNETHKECSSCGKLKIHSEFYKDKSNLKTGLSYYCMECCRIKARKYTADNKDNIRHRRAKKNNYIKHRFGISIEDYESRLNNQNYKCAICKEKLNTTDRNLAHLDHCHATEKIREFLCCHCNRGLGGFRDNLEFLSSAISYLKKHHEQKDSPP